MAVPFVKICIWFFIWNAISLFSLSLSLRAISVKRQKKRDVWSNMYKYMYILEVDARGNK